MKIIFYCGYSIEEWSPKSQKSGIGGSEEATIEVSRELAKLGHEVTVYNRCGDDEGTYDGVKFENYEYFDETEADILILWREPDYVLKFKDVKAKKILWLHDTISELQILPVIHFLDHIFVLSTYHAGLYKNIPKEKLVVTQNGINLNHFKQKVDRDPYKLVYGSSYDRGLLELLEMWQEIKLAVPEATLNVFYGWGGIDKQIEAGNEEFQNFKDRIEYLLKQEGIKHLGRISHDEVAKEFLSAGVWVYPCWFPEISCCVGDTPILMPRDHKKYPSGIPIKDLVGKKDFYVYAYDHDNERIELGKVLWVKKTRKNAELLKITLDDGTVLRFTPDHKFMMRDGSYKEAKDLKPLDSLMPCYERPTFSIKQHGGHWEDEHRMAAKAKYGNIDGLVIDHKDGNRFNNDIDNLDPVTPSQHAKKTFSEQSFHSNKSKEKRISSLKKWLSSDEGKEKLSKNGTNRANKFWSMFREWPEEKQKEWLANRRSKIVNSGAVTATPEQKAAWGKEGAMKRWHNHKVVSIEKDLVREDVYDMEVEKYHNFAAGGVFVHNCITAMKAQAGGTLPVITPTAALDQTVKWGLTTRIPRDERGSMPWGTPMDDSLRENYIRLTINALNPDTQKKWRKKMMEESIINSWAVVAKSWEALFGENNDNI